MNIATLFLSKWNFLLKAAIMFGYPGELLYKLYERKAKSLFQLFGFPAHGAFEALEKAAMTVEASKLNEAKKEEFVKVSFKPFNGLTTL